MRVSCGLLKKLVVMYCTENLLGTYQLPFPQFKFTSIVDAFIRVIYSTKTSTW